MTDARFESTNADPPVGLEDVIRTAGEVADKVRDAAGSVARLGERELAMLVGIAEDIRDSVVARERLESARRIETIQGVRRSAHRSVDLGFDAAAVGVDVGIDFIDAAFRRPNRKSAVQPAVAPASAPPASAAI